MQTEANLALQAQLGVITKQVRALSLALAGVGATVDLPPELPQQVELVAVGVTRADKVPLGPWDSQELSLPGVVKVASTIRQEVEHQGPIKDRLVVKVQEAKGATADHTLMRQALEVAATAVRLGTMHPPRAIMLRRLARVVAMVLPVCRGPTTLSG